MPFVAPTVEREKCAKCGGTVYPAEEVIMQSRSYHPECLKCTRCKKKCTPMNSSFMGSDLYCTTHYKEMLRRTGNYDGLRDCNSLPEPEKNWPSQENQADEVKIRGRTQSVRQAATLFAAKLDEAENQPLPPRKPQIELPEREVYTEDRPVVKRKELDPELRELTVGRGSVRKLGSIFISDQDEQPKKTRPQPIKLPTSETSEDSFPKFHRPETHVYQPAKPSVNLESTSIADSSSVGMGITHVSFTTPTLDHSLLRPNASNGNLTADECTLSSGVTQIARNYGFDS